MRVKSFDTRLCFLFSRVNKRPTTKRSLKWTQIDLSTALRLTIIKTNTILHSVAPVHFTYWPGAHHTITLPIPLFHYFIICNHAHIPMAPSSPSARNTLNQHTKMMNMMRDCGISYSHRRSTTQHNLTCCSCPINIPSTTIIIINGIYSAFSLLLFSHKPHENDELCARLYTIAFCSNFTSSLIARFAMRECIEYEYISACSGGAANAVDKKKIKPLLHSQLTHSRPEQSLNERKISHLLQLWMKLIDKIQTKRHSVDRLSIHSKRNEIN